ncbi:interleukin-27 subunit beta [Discoglossus pictus]
MYEITYSLKHRALMALKKFILIGVWFRMIWMIPLAVSLLLCWDVTLGHRGSPKKMHIECWAMSYPEKLRCTWDLHHHTKLPTTFITTYWLGLAVPESPQQCAQSALDPNSCLISNLEMFADYPYILNVTATNSLGSITQLHHFIVEDIIRPDPPEGLTLSPIPGQRKRLHLSWRPASSWPLVEYFPLKYFIQYKKEGRGSYKTIGPYEQTFVILTGISPRSALMARVAAKDFTDYGNVSEWSTVVTGKPWGHS